MVGGWVVDVCGPSSCGIGADICTIDCFFACGGFLLDDETRERECFFLRERDVHGEEIKIYIIYPKHTHRLHRLYYTVCDDATTTESRETRKDVLFACVVSYREGTYTFGRYGWFVSVRMKIFICL